MYIYIFVYNNMSFVGPPYKKSRKLPKKWGNFEAMYNPKIFVLGGWDHFFSFYWSFLPMKTTLWMLKSFAKLFENTHLHNITDPIFNDFFFSFLFLF